MTRQTSAGGSVRRALAAAGCASNKVYRIYAPEKCVKAIDGSFVCESEEE